MDCVDFFLEFEFFVKIIKLYKFWGCKFIFNYICGNSLGKQYNFDIFVVFRIYHVIPNFQLIYLDHIIININLQLQMDNQKLFQNVEQQQIRYQNQLNPNRLIKDFYRNELDNLVNEKNKMKQINKERQEEERKIFNQRIQQNKQLQKLKDVSYKNYYQILMSGQQNNLEHYVSPFQKRQNMKMSHINIAMEEQKRKAEMEEIERIKRLEDIKNNYKRGLLNQMEEKKMMDNQKKMERQRQKQMFERFGKLPQEINKWQKDKKKQEMYKYKQDLDRLVVSKQTQRTHSNNMNQNNGGYRGDMMHNPVINPMPYNIQNPYILKELQKGMKNTSYLAGIGNSGLK